MSFLNIRYKSYNYDGKTKLFKRESIYKLIDAFYVCFYVNVIKDYSELLKIIRHYNFYNL